MSCCSFRNNFTNLLKIFELISLTLASLFPGRAENKLFIFYLSPDNSSELCCGLAAVFEDNPAWPGESPFYGPDGFRTCIWPRRPAFYGPDGSRTYIWPRIRPFPGPERVTSALHEVAGTIQQSFMFISLLLLPVSFFTLPLYCH